MTDKKPAKKPAKKTPAKKDGQPGPKTMKVFEGTKGPELKSVPKGKVVIVPPEDLKKTVETVQKIAEVHNLDPKDINSEVYEDRPLIAEQDLAIKVLSLCEAGQFELAAKEIEIAVRLAHQVEAAQ